MNRTTQHFRPLAKLAALALALIGAFTVTSAVAPAYAGTVNGCPAGDVCVYPGASWNNGVPQLAWSAYGAHDLSNMYGSHRVFNNQTGGAVAATCTQYGGGGCTWHGAGWYADVDLTPVNSIALEPGNQYTVFRYMQSAGYSKIAAAGVVGNLVQESGAELNPYASDGVGHGIAQWSAGGRWDTNGSDNMVWYAGTLGQSAYAISAEERFITYELNYNPSYFGKSALANATSVNNATIAFQTYYERCGNCQTATRESYAATAYRMFG
ncbi:phage tail tip lysozyme [Nocardioides ultimimeridianus]